MKKTLLAVLVSSAFGMIGSAQAANYYLDGQQLPAEKHTLEGNLVSGLLVEGGGTIGGSGDFIGTGTPSTSFDPARTLDTTYNGLTLTGGDLIGGHYLRGIGNNDSYDASINTVNLKVINSSIEENLIAGSKIVAYGSSEALSSIQNVNLTLDKTTVKLATIVGNQLKSSGQDIKGSVVSNAKVVIQNGSKLNGLILGGVAAYMSGDNTPGANTVSNVGKVDLTITDSTVEKLAENAISGLPHDFGGAALIMGGVSSNPTSTTITGSATVDSVKMTVSGTTVNGNVLMGGLSNFAEGVATVKQSTLVLGEGTNIQGSVVANGITQNNGSSSVEKVDIVLDSSKVTIKDGVTQLSASANVVGTGKFNDDFASGAAAVEGLRSITQVGEAQDLVIEEGFKNGATTVVDGVVHETTNSLQENTLNFATGTVLALDRILNNDVRKRMGDLRAMSTNHGVWARYDGGRLSGKHGLENDFNTVQVGVDTMPIPGSARFGVAISYTEGDADFNRGTADLEAFTLAAYSTWFNENGLFVDVIGRMAKANTNMNVEGYKADLDNMMLGLSGELGWRFDATEMFYAEPSLELSYSYITDDTVEFGDRAIYKLESTNSLVARAGVATGIKCPNNMGDVYVRLGVAHQFLGDGKLSVVDGQSLALDGKDTWFEYGIGANFNISKNTYLWADIERTAGSLLDEDVRGTVGVRFGF